MGVLINGRGVVHAKSQGSVTTTSINLTGKKRIPIPYPNIAYSADAAATARSVLVEGQALCHKKSYFSKSTGDEPGQHGGVISGTVNGIAEFITASPNVFIESQPAVRTHDLMVSNHRNTQPAPLEQSDITKASDASELPSLDDKLVQATDHHIVWEIQADDVSQLKGTLSAHLL